MNDTQPTPLRVQHGEATSAIQRDLWLNLERLLTEGALPPSDAALVAFSLSRSAGLKPVEAQTREHLAASGFTPDEIAEAHEAPAMMGMLNVYYRFKTLLGKEEEYGTAKLRMTALARPALGKKRWEAIAFALSVLNGCQSCVRSHEDVLRKEGYSVDQIHDLARLAAVIGGLTKL